MNTDNNLNVIGLSDKVTKDMEYYKSNKEAFMKKYILLLLLAMQSTKSMDIDQAPLQELLTKVQSKSNKNEFIKKYIQLLPTMKSIKAWDYIDQLQELPTEVQMNIVNYLDFKALGQFMLVDKKSRKLVSTQASLPKTPAAVRWGVLFNEKKVTPIRYNAHSVNAVAISPNGRFIVISSSDCRAKIWDVKTGDCLHTLTGHTSEILSIAISADNNFIVTGSDDTTAKLWDVETGKCLHTLEGHDRGVTSVAISADCSFIVTGSHDSTAKVWDVETGECLRTLTGHDEFVCQVAISADCSFIVTCSFDDTAKVWNAKTGICLRTLAGHDHQVYSAKISLNGSFIATCSMDGTAKIWDAKNAKCLHTLTGHTYWPSVAISEDNNFIVTGPADNTAKIWDVNTGKCLHVLGSQRKTVAAICWAMLFNKKNVTQLKCHTDVILSMAISVDCSFIVTGSVDNTAMIWDVRTGKCLHTLTGHTSKILSVAISVDNNFIVTRSADNTAIIWSIAEAIKRHSGEITPALADQVIDFSDGLD